MHDQGEDLHIALWPYVKETHQLASRHYAYEGRCFVVAVGQVMHKDELPSELSISDKIDIHESGLILRGGSSVYGPEGQEIMPPKYLERGLFTLNLDLSERKKHLMNLAVSGHYNRPDVFDFTVSTRRKGS